MPFGWLETLIPTGDQVMVASDWLPELRDVCTFEKRRGEERKADRIIVMRDIWT